jgi:hypothetical protein
MNSRITSEYDMVMSPTACAICLSRDGYACVSGPYENRDAAEFECDVCGHYAVSRSALISVLDKDYQPMTFLRRAVLSHRIRSANDAGRFPDMLMTYEIEAFLADDPKLPSAAQQATNIIRFIGNIVAGTGVNIEMLLPSFSASVGSPSRSFAVSLAYELKQRGLVTGYEIPSPSNPGNMQDVSLTLPGWEVYEAERKGQTSGNYGFIALETGHESLEPLIKDHIKPSLADIGYDLVDYRDISKAGIIDNILRVQIRDSAFVLVDLTHDNRGAYWEAGYAEGLGKPVLYICEKSKFEGNSTHFDTNHCTTVQWDVDNIPEFIANLTATLKRSLNI